ncbi:hypothetical protein C0Q70_18300 [Pomacea canaliculata]|uniref:DUF7789 domain-containing protein n=1 Tax=Pomacea canaliculata TaxID=400727 RepID=A0A2T7NMV3_POMCA|nr:uncharacterized protein LOC112575190 isoform X1 [Pomacea canaliculata]PVD22486.1 hypothetical protein C0Q70_18300 [Pomacea canaliculata]
MAEAAADDAGPITFADLGIPQGPQLQESLLGKARSIKDLERKEYVYTVVAVLTLVVTTGFTIYKISTVGRDNPDFTFALILLTSSVFGIYYVVHGVLQERATEIIIFSVANFAVLMYLIVNYAAGSKDDIKLARLIIAVVLCPFLICAGVWIGVSYHQSGNLIFRTVGASTELQRICRTVFFFFDILKFDLQLAISMVLLIVVPGKLNTEEIVVLSVGSVLCLAWFVLGFYGMKYENKIGAIMFLAMSPLEVAYVIYKLVKTASVMQRFGGLAGSTIVCGVIALVVRILVVIAAVLVIRSFNKGLKQKAFGIEEHQTGNIINAEDPGSSGAH